MSFHKPASLPAALILLGVVPGTVLAQSQSSPSSSPSASQMSDDDMSNMDMSTPAKPGWTVMTHGALSLVSDSQGGPRGAYKNFAEGMVMIMATHTLGDHDDIALDAMLSPDAFMGKSGYPLLLQTGETADGVHPLVDRQHPHDLFMGLTATLTHHFSASSKAFLTLGYPGEFAFGPTAFMHRASGEDFPTAPISHHWLDSGHITMGVVTGGFSQGSLQLEISEFTGREPDQYRFNLDPIRLDSTAARLTWTITPDLKAQASLAHQVSPEELEPLVNLDKRSLSLEYGRKLMGMRLASTLAYGWRRAEHSPDKPRDAWLFENTLHVTPKWEGLVRFERVYNDELTPSNAAYWVAKTEVGGVRTFALNKTMSLGLGVVQQFNSVPAPLKAAYGDHPEGTVVFMTLKFHTMSGAMSQDMAM